MSAHLCRCFRVSFNLSSSIVASVMNVSCISKTSKIFIDRLLLFWYVTLKVSGIERALAPCFAYSKTSSTLSALLNLPTLPLI